MTRGYAPYEQDNPAWADQGPWTDIYSLGATLHFAITGDCIISSQERASASMTGKPDPYQPLAERYRGQYSQYFLNAIDHALQFQPANRPQDVATWDRELKGEDSDAEDATRIAPPPEDISAQETFIQTKPLPLMAASTLSGQGSAATGVSVLTHPAFPNQRPLLLAAAFTVVVLAAAGIYYYFPSPDPVIAPTSPTPVPTTAAPSPTTQEAAPELVAVKVEAALLHAREAVVDHGKVLRHQQSISQLEGLSSTSTSRTALIATLKIEINTLDQSFEASASQYADNIRELHAYPEAAIRQAASTLIATKHQNKPSFSTLGELLPKHARLDTDETVWRNDLKDLGKKLNQGSTLPQ